MKVLVDYLPIFLKAFILGLVTYLIMTVIPLPLPKLTITASVLLIYILVEGLEILLRKFQTEFCKKEDISLKEELGKKLDLLDAL